MMDVDPDHRTIQESCQRLVGKEFVLSISLDYEIVPLEDSEGLNNAVGSILEHAIFWVLKKDLLYLERGPKQKSPDYYNRKEYEYELKVFEKNAGFDISSYNAYVHQLCLQGGVCRKLFKTKYLVFKYSLTGCKITLQNFWMLNVWDLVNCSCKYPIGIQNKHGIWYNIRPSHERGWTDSQRDAKTFIESIIKSVYSCPNPLPKDKIIDDIKKQLLSLSF